MKDQDKNTVANPYDKVEGMLLYTRIHDAAESYQKPGTPPKCKEWKTSIVLTDEDYLDELEDWAKKNDVKLSLKKVKTTEFEEVYKTKPPEDAAKSVWVWTLRKSVELGKTGKPVPDKYKPKVYQRKGTTLVDITATVLVGNGSIGVVSTDLFVRNNGSASIYLKNVLVKDLVEYIKEESDSSYVEGSEFGIPVEDTEDKSEKKSKVVESEEDDSSPF